MDRLLNKALQAPYVRGGCLIPITVPYKEALWNCSYIYWNWLSATILWKQTYYKLNVKNQYCLMSQNKSNIQAGVSLYIAIVSQTCWCEQYAIKIWTPRSLLLSISSCWDKKNVISKINIYFKYIVEYITEWTYF